MHVLDVVLPRRCGVCRRVGTSLCTLCAARLVHCRPPWCERCGSPGPWPVRRCADCVGRRLAYASVRAALVYEDRARAFVASWKERGRRDLAAVACDLVITNVLRPNVEAVTFVPADRDRGLARGHAPATELAAALARSWSLPLVPLLERRPGIRRQRDLPRRERRANVARAFASCAPAPARVLLVDDVVTTGSTATACASALRGAGARQVEVVCLARAIRR